MENPSNKWILHPFGNITRKLLNLKKTQTGMVYSVRVFFKKSDTYINIRKLFLYEGVQMKQFLFYYESLITLKFSQGIHPKTRPLANSKSKNNHIIVRWRSSLKDPMRS